MDSISEIHDKAMREAAKADLAKMMGDQESFQQLLRAAYELEMVAAEKVKNRLALEPTRSVLFRSAAWLAFECGELREAERLACIGLSGNPPEEIADELREVFERANFHRHLKLHGYVLHEEELQMSLAGDDVMPGIANFQTVTDRAICTVQALYRTAQRTLGKPYRDQIPTKLKKKITPYMTVARAASFAFTIRLAEMGGGDQECLPGFSLGATVVDEFLTCTEFLVQNRVDSLKTRINNEAYFRNFLKLTEKIAPDGRNIKMVGFTTIQGGKTREVNLVTSQERLKAISTPEETSGSSEDQPINLKGKLLYADATGAQDEIRILDQQGNKHKVRVPEGLMDDIVRPLWNRQVEVEGLTTRGVTVLSDIRACEEDESS
jgi:hypothetical protein